MFSSGLFAGPMCICQTDVFSSLSIYILPSGSTLLESPTSFGILDVVNRPGFRDNGQWVSFMPVHKKITW